MWGIRSGFGGNKEEFPCTPIHTHTHTHFQKYLGVSGEGSPARGHPAELGPLRGSGEPNRDTPPRPPQRRRRERGRGPGRPLSP